MLYAWIDGEKRPPLVRGERTLCDCQAELLAVMPIAAVAHWRHKGRDCDPWSEGETAWHLGWKQAFDLRCREVSLVDPVTGERHRADVRHDRGEGRPTILELQHSPIAEEERLAREAFYGREHRLFWLVHIHNEGSMLASNFSMSLNMSARTIRHRDKVFAIMDWMGRSLHFIEKWKRSNASVFFDLNGAIFFLAGPILSACLENHG